MFRALRSEQMYSSPFPMRNTPYVAPGSTKQFVWPTIVSGRSVAAIRYTFSSFSEASFAGFSSSLILMQVNICGSTPSPEARSWSAQICPSSGE